MVKKQAFKIVAAGEHFAAVMRAQELSKRLATELAPQFAISSNAWKFEALGNAKSAKAAAASAAKADMVIIAASGENEPPAVVKNWIKSWLPRKHKGTTALIALLDHEDDALHKSSPLCAYLRKAAKKTDMNFISNSAGWWQQYLESAAETTPSRSEFPEPDKTKMSGHNLMQPHITSLGDKLEILNLTRKLWLQAGQPSGRLGDFWKTAEQQFAASSRS